MQICVDFKKNSFNDETNASSITKDIEKLFEALGVTSQFHLAGIDADGTQRYVVSINEQYSENDEWYEEVYSLSDEVLDGASSLVDKVFFSIGASRKWVRCGETWFETKSEIKRSVVIDVHSLNRTDIMKLSGF